MIMNGNTPTLISGVPNVALSFAITRSQASATPSAPPSVWPFAAQIEGLPSSPSRRNSSGKRLDPKCLWISGTSPAKPDRFAPPEKTRSCEDVSTTQRTASSSRQRSSAATRSSSSSLESALRDSGSSSVIVATPSSTANRMVV